MAGDLSGVGDVAILGRFDRPEEVALVVGEVRGVAGFVRDRYQSLLACPLLFLSRTKQMKRL